MRGPIKGLPADALAETEMMPRHRAAHEQTGVDAMGYPAILIAGTPSLDLVQPSALGRAPRVARIRSSVLACR